MEKLVYEKWKYCKVDLHIAEKCEYFRFKGQGWTYCSCPDKECVQIKGEVPEQMSDVYHNVITLCGSSKFRDKFLELEEDLYKKGFCVILPYWHGFLHKEKYKNEEWKGRLAEVHYRKIDLSTHIFVVNVDGYIGEDTQRDIDYAKQQGKHILYLEPMRE